MTAHKMVGEYEIKGLLGLGGMSRVFLAELAGPGRFRRRVALKLMRADTDIDDASLLLRDEAANLSCLNHPNLVTVNRVGHIRDRFFIEMEYIEGVSLRHLRDEMFVPGRPLPPIDLIASIIARACDGLHSAHEQCDHDGRPLNLVHRDISPHNLMLSQQGVVKVIDFGVARTANRIWETQPGRMVGKPAYMAPEQIEEARQRRLDYIDRRVDLWAIGAVLYEMCVGARVFGGRGIVQILHNVQQQAVPPLSERRPDAPPPLTALVARLLSRDRDARPATASDVSAMLKQIAHDAGGAYADRARLTDWFAAQGISLVPAAPKPMSADEEAWLDGPVGRSTMVRDAPRSTGSPDGAEPAVDPEGSAWSAALGAQLGGGRFRLTETLEHGHEQSGRLERRWYGGTDLRTGQPVVIELIATLGRHEVGWLDAPLAAQVEHIEASHPARGRLLGSGEACWPGSRYLAYARPATTLDTFYGRTQTAATRVAVARAVIHALAAAQQAAGGFVHGMLVPLEIGLHEVGPRRFEAHLLGVSLRSLETVTDDGTARAWSMPVGDHQAPETTGPGPLSAAGDVYSIAGMIYRLFGGDPKTAQRVAHGDSPRLLAAGALDGRRLGGILAGLRSEAHERPTAAQLYARFVDDETTPDPEPPSGLCAPVGESTEIHVDGHRGWLTLLCLEPHGTRRGVELPLPRIESLAPASLWVDIERGADEPVLRLGTDASTGGRAPKLYRDNVATRAVLLRPQGHPPVVEYGHRTARRLRLVCHSRTYRPGEARAVQLPGLGLAVALPASTRMAITLHTTVPESDEVHIVCVCITQGGMP